MAKLDPLPSYRATAERSGLYYRVWCLFWPLVVTLIYLRRPGSLGLRPPSTPSLHELRPSDRIKYRKWWKNYIWNGTRIAIGSGRGEVNGLAHISLATYLVIIEIIFRSNYNEMELFAILLLTSVGIFYV